jgi:hypothetical protein
MQGVRVDDAIVPSMAMWCGLVGCEVVNGEGEVVELGIGHLELYLEVELPSW